MKCQSCGTENNVGASFCNKCGQPFVAPILNLNQNANTSGMGKGATIPSEIRKWNWGAFLLSWIWGLGNNTFIALAALVPFIGVVVVVVLGIKGNEWAWQNKKWDSTQHFLQVQKKWAIWGLVSPIALFLMLLLWLVVLTEFVSFPQK